MFLTRNISVLVLFDTVKHCGTLFPPEDGKVLLPCYTTFGSTCIRDCKDGYVAFGGNLATCRSINSSHVAWDIGNFTCEGRYRFVL